ncbi:hypothetical protein AKO1_009456 [Acrasis kona]|uniref:PIN domain-containing protein n=1 Tax=Acrasis kona TaxID=1008807 RepID=A0AAW2ZKC8_9EUKA
MITVITPHNQHNTSPNKDYQLTKTEYCLLFTQWGDELNNFVVQDCKRTGNKILIQFVPEDQCLSIMGEPSAVNDIYPRISEYIKYITRGIEVTQKLHLQGNNGNYNWKSVWVPVNKKKQTELQQNCAVLPLNKKEGTCVLVGPQPQLGKFEEWFRKTYCSSNSGGNHQKANHHNQQKSNNYNNQSNNQKSSNQNQQKPNNQPFNQNQQKNNKQKKKLVLQDYSKMFYDYGKENQQATQKQDRARNPEKILRPQQQFVHSTNRDDAPSKQTQEPQPKKKDSNKKRNKDKKYERPQIPDGIVLETTKYTITPYQACYLFTHHLRQLRKFADTCCENEQTLAFSDFNSRSTFIEIGGVNQQVITQFKSLLDKALLNLEHSKVITIPEKWQLDNIVVPMDARRRHIFQRDCAVSFHTQSDQIVLVGRQPRLGIFESWVHDMINPPNIKSFKNVVLCDTNIYAHRDEQKYLEQLYSRRDLVMAVPERVRSELDRMKTYEDDNAYRAREALRNVSACGLVKNKVLLQQDGQLPKIKFNVNKQDDEIVAYGLYLHEVVGRKIALVTRDAGMKQRAQAYSDRFDIYPTLRSLLSVGGSEKDAVDDLVENLKKLNVNKPKSKVVVKVVEEEVMSDDGDENWEDVSDDEWEDVEDDDDEWEDVSDDDE